MEEGTSIEEKVPSDWPVCNPIMYFLNSCSMLESEGSVFEGSATSGLVSWFHKKNQAKQAIGNKPSSSTSPWSLHQFLP